MSSPYVKQKRTAMLTRKSKTGTAHFAQALKRLAAIFFTAVLGVALAPLSGCVQKADTTGSATDYETRVASLKGPTSVGLLNMMEKNEHHEFPEHYDFSIEASAETIVQKLIAGDIDIALIPANVASLLYQKTAGEIRALDVCATSVLDIVAPVGEVQSFSDLAGKTLYTIGKGTSPEYALQYLLKEANLAESVDIQYKQDATEVVSALSENPESVALLPQPFATVATKKVPTTEVALDLSSPWQEYAPADSKLVCAVTVLRQSYLEEHEKLAEEFLRHQDDSVKKATNNIGDTARLMVSYGIVDDIQVAREAIPYCGLCCMRNKAMKEALQGYLSVLFAEDPASVGGALPDEHFYVSQTI